MRKREVETERGKEGRPGGERKRVEWMAAGDRLPAKGRNGDPSPAHARRAWERALSCPDNPSPSRSRVHRTRCHPLSVFRSRRDSPDSSLPSSTACRSPSLARASGSALESPASLAVGTYPTTRIADHGRARTTQGPAGARCCSSRGAQYLGDRQCK